MNTNDTVLRLSVFCGAALAVVAASDTPSPEIRLTAGALAAGFGALVALLRPPNTPAISQPEPPLTKAERKDAIREFIQEHARPANQGGGRG